MHADSNSVVQTKLYFSWAYGMHLFELDYAGNIQEKELFRKEIADELKTHSRDLRSIFSYKQLATITPRKHGIIINIHELKVIIGTDRAMVFDIHSPDLSLKFVSFLSEKIQTAEKDTYFPFLVLESLFFFAYQNLDHIHDDLEKSTHRVFRKLKASQQDESLEELLALKKKLNKLEISVGEIEETITDILKDDDEMKELCLKENQKAERIDEVESILEHAWERIEDLNHRISELSENINDTQEIIILKLSSRRNTIIRIDLFINFATAVLSGMAVVAGVFGMNLLSHYERSQSAFYIVISLMFLFVILVITIVMLQMKKKKIW